MNRERHTKDWLAGYEAGLAGQPYVVPANVLERMAWRYGYVEGKEQAGRKSRERL